MSTDFESFLRSDPEAWRHARALRGAALLAPLLPLGTLVGCIAAAVGLWSAMPPARLAIGASGGLVLSALLWLNWRTLAARCTGGIAHDMPLVLRYLRMGALAVGGFWAVWSLALLPIGSPAQQTTLAFVLAAATAVWLPLFVLDRITLLTLASTVLLPTTLALLSPSPLAFATSLGSTLLLLLAALIVSALMLERMLDADSASQSALYHQATHDSLVGLSNRAEFDRCLSGRRTARCAVVLVDLDEFKTVNDTAGHDAGDRLLKEVGAILREEKRKMDVAARIGGDEFAILMELCSDHEALRVAGAVLNRIRRLALEHGDWSLRISASIGIACSSASLVTARDVLVAADRACYAAKRAGGGRIKLASENARTRDQTFLAAAPARLVRQAPAPARAQREEGCELAARSGNA